MLYDVQKLIVHRIEGSSIEIEKEFDIGEIKVNSLSEMDVFHVDGNQFIEPATDTAQAAVGIYLSTNRCGKIALVSLNGNLY